MSHRDIPSLKQALVSLHAQHMSEEEDSCDDTQCPQIPIGQRNKDIVNIDTDWETRFQGFLLAMTGLLQSEKQISDRPLKFTLNLNEAL